MLSLKFASLPDPHLSPTLHTDEPTNPGHGFRCLATHCKGTSERESDTDYRRVLFGIGVDWRVIVCKDEIQFILQRILGGKWRAKSYPSSREGLRQAIKRHCGADACLAAKADIEAISF